MDLYPIVKQLAKESIPFGTMITIPMVAERAGSAASTDEILTYLKQHEDDIRREVGAPVWETTIEVVDLDGE